LHILNYKLEIPLDLLKNLPCLCAVLSHKLAQAVSPLAPVTQPTNPRKIEKEIMRISSEKREGRERERKRGRRRRR
jgi:hypothetical protein